MLIHNQNIGLLARQKILSEHRYYVLKMIVNGASTTFGHASWKIQWLSGNLKPSLYYLLSL